MSLLATSPHSNHSSPKLPIAGVRARVPPQPRSLGNTNKTESATSFQAEHSRPHRMKPNQLSLPANAFLRNNTYDPLRHSTQDLFWYHVEPHFNPATVEDLEILKQVKPQLPSILSPSSTTGKTQTDATHQSLDRLQSYPLAQRLTAALLDEGKGESHAGKPVRCGLTSEDSWLGGSPDALHTYNTALEDRIRIELEDCGLLDADQGKQLLTELRMDHWHLRNLISANNSMRGGVLRLVSPEIGAQGTRREQKNKDDQTEIKYLETMMEKGGKRGKGRFNKLLNQMHPNRNLLPGDPIHGLQKSASGAVGENAISKKRKRKHSTGEKPAQKNNTDNNGVLPADAAENLAPHIADIIWKHNNQAHIDDIVKESLKRVPQLAGDVKEARRRITNCMSFSRKPFRFRKLPDGVTYSATRV